VTSRSHDTPIASPSPKRYSEVRLARDLVDRGDPSAPMNQKLGTVVNLGGFLLEEDRLARRGRTVPLAPKELSTFRLLAERSPRVVTADMILSAVWGGAHRSKSSVSQCIAKLRRKLRAAGAADLLNIETAYGQGYRLTVHAQNDVRDPS
jgi:DNA-binding winged helix-turn-helix (wHTH) protein